MWTAGNTHVGLSRGGADVNKQTYVYRFLTPPGKQASPKKAKERAFLAQIGL